MSCQLTPLRGRGLFGIASVSWGCYPQDRLMRIPKVQVHGLRVFKPLHDTKGSGTSVPRDWLNGQSFEDQYKYGLDVLKKYGY